MPNKNTTLANITRIVDVDANYWPTLVKTANLGTGTADTTTFLRGDRTWATPSEMGVVSSVAMTVPTGFSITGSPITTSGTLAVGYSGLIPLTSLGTGLASATTYLKGDATWDTPVLSLAANVGGTARVGAIKLLSGTNVTIVDNNDGTFTFNSTGGGGGGSFTTTATWSSGATSKNAFTSPGVVNTQGIVINLVASAGSGQITNTTVRLNSVALTNTYDSTGTWPNLTITIPSADLTGNAAETAASVVISLTGTFAGSGVNIPTVGTLTNVQPIAFSTTLSASYSPNSRPFYTTTSTINYSYSNSGNITAFNGVITPSGGTAQNASAASGSFTNQPIAGATISGSATGNGQFGAGSTTVTLSGSIPAVNVYIPAFYSQTVDSTPPVFTTSSNQTSGGAQGSSITYPSATAVTQYNWIATQRPLANIMIVTPFGNAPLVPDVTAPTQTISGQVFNVYGFTRLTVGQSAQLVIS